ncbi:vacuolar protein-sorting protein BRO1 [Ipomoea triloba]|uniref:vacuolar protein-sorting protein BRO1 n=1 Tax=Ipomoea triloba TaxID=35885 RepID=UPI00125D24F5|nr:vacuolar protein-sorting protein BRO1 [Ipomoea triloba]
MMITFQGLAKLKASQVIFEDAFVASDPGTLEQLKELSSRRRSIEFINKNSCVTEAIAREMSGGLTSRSEQNIKNLEQYLPLLENLIGCVDLIKGHPRVVGWVSDLKITWSSPLTSSSFFNNRSPKLHQINDLRFELGMALFLYGALLQDLAREVLCTDLVQSTSLFRKAAGVYHHIAHEVLPNLQHNLRPEGPPEALTTVSDVFSLICLAEAQAVAATKAEQKGTTGGLLAKLHCGVSEFLEKALCNMQVAIKNCKDISSHFMDYISSCKTLHELESYKYLAESLKSDGQTGAAIGVLHFALKSKQKHNKPKEESWRSVYNQIIDSMTALLQKYERENEVVWHEKIPAPDQLPSPEGVKIVSCIPYQPQKWERSLVFKI